MMVPKHRDALVTSASATVNFRAGTGSGPSPRGPGTATVPHFLGRYRVLGEIARGGMGVVLLAYDPVLDRELAVKLQSPDIAPDSEAGRRFAQEARVAGQLDHPGIIPVYEAGALPDGRAYFAMPLVHGRTLAALLAERTSPQIGIDRWLAAFERICAAVAYAHNRGVVHRDLKPGNVMIGDFGQVVVMDWGVAAERSTPQGASDGSGYWVFGTPAYMSPEQARGACPGDPRGDVFGLGAILCEILTGHPPYLGPDSATVTQHAAAGNLGAAVRRLDGSGADPGLIDLARRCLSIDPVDRPADAGEVARLVHGHLAGAGALQRNAARDRRERWATGALMVAAAIAAALTVGMARDLQAQSAVRVNSTPARPGVTP